MPPHAPARESLLSDALLQHLIAVGQVDVLVGLPTLNNAATVGPAVVAVHEAIARYFGRTRVTVLNSDGGSEDGTQDVVRGASGGSADVLLASHTLRTIHRVIAPFHGLPGRRNALRTIFAAADLLQARAVAIIDPAAPEPSADVIAASIRGVLTDGYDFVGLAPLRHPREGPVLTQFVRPLFTAVHGTMFEDPLGQQFVLSSRLVAHALAQPGWDEEALRAGIDLWLHAEALLGGRRAMQIVTPPRARPGPARATVRETVLQIARATWMLLEWNERWWTEGEPAAASITTAGSDGTELRSPVWDPEPMERTFREDVEQLAPILSSFLSTGAQLAVESAAAGTGPVVLSDEAWVQMVTDFSLAWRARRLPPDHLAGAFVPLYLARVASYVRETEALDTRGAAARLQQLNEAFARGRERLATHWRESMQSGEPR